MTDLSDTRAKLAEELAVLRGRLAEQDGSHGRKAEFAHLKTTVMMARSVAHDVNNLMGAVLGNAALLRVVMSGNEAGRRMLDEIERAAERAGVAAQHLIAYAQGGHERPRVMNLNAIANQVLHLEEQDLAPRIRVVRYIEPDLWDIEADVAQVHRVVMTLAMNAVESIEGEGRVVIVTRNLEIDETFARACPGLHPGKHVCLTVEDTGQGMDAETVARIFDSTFTPASPGRPQNLAALLATAREQGGHISVYSEAGQGATFMVYFPAVVSPVKELRAKSRKSAAGKETVLIIDDEPMVLNVTKEVLHQLGYQTLTARNGQEAVEIAKTHDGSLDLALLDMAMPVMGGAETYPLLKKARPNLKVIICSALELDSISKALLNAGVSGYLQKPYQAAVLSQTIRKVLDK